MPGLAAKFKDGGYGFDYRMAMNIPDYWIKTIKELADEAWKPSSIFWEIKNRLIVNHTTKRWWAIRLLSSDQQIQICIGISVRETKQR